MALNRVLLCASAAAVASASSASSAVASSSSSSSSSSSAAAGAAAAAAAAPAFDCSFASSYPKTYVAYRNFDRDLVVDGRLDDAAWQEVGFTDDFVDISTGTTPRLRTNVKMRFDDDFLYVGARLQETMLAANITYTCHCNDEPGDQVVFHDNDFEIFVDADGSTHQYKEYEMNAANMNGTSATWDLLLDKTYTDGGNENSSRVYGANGWDDMVPRDRGHCMTFSDGVLNDPQHRPTFWSAEVALPLKKLAELTSAAGERVGSGKVWRINFSRVEWALNISADGKSYLKYPSCQSCPDPGGDHEDNWVWSPQGAIAMHQPEMWGWLQFSDDGVNATAPAVNPEWPVRSAAMIAYYAQMAYRGANNGSYARSVRDLLPFASAPQALDGTCFATPTFVVSDDGGSYNCSITDPAAGLTASIRNDRYLRVRGSA